MPQRVLFVLRGNPAVVASTRERVARYFPYLEEQGIRYKTVIPPARAKVQFYLWPYFYLRLLMLGLGCKVILIQKDIFALWVWRCFRALGKKIIYDFDDAIFIEPPKGQWNVFCHTLRPRASASLVADMVRTANLVTVANDYLAQFARRYNPNVEILPVPVDVEKFSGRQQKANGALTIGWLGSAQTAGFLGIVNAALQEVQARYGQRIAYKFVTRAQIPLKNVSFEQKPWEPATELEDIGSFDIGLVPLPKGNDFAEGKSSFKLMQFMAAGLPVVCSGIGYNREIIKHGQNGFLADTTEEWVARLGELIESKELRERLGAAAKATARESFDLKITLPRFLRLFAAPGYAAAR